MDNIILTKQQLHKWGQDLSQVLLTAHVGFGLLPSAQKIYTENVCYKIATKNEMFLSNADPTMGREVELLCQN